MAHISKYSYEDLRRNGWLTKRELRERIAVLKRKHSKVSDLPAKLDRAMNDARMLHAYLGLVVEADVVFTNGRRPALYSPELPQIWVAFLRWNSFQKVKSKVQEAQFMYCLLSCDESIRHHVPNWDEFVRGRRQSKLQYQHGAITVAKTVRLRAK